MKRRWLLFPMLILLLAAPLGAVFAQDGRDRSGVYVESFALREGDVVDGDLVVIVLDGSITLHSGSHITGDATLINLGGTVSVSGTVDGNLDVLAVGSVITLHGAQLGGSVNLCASRVENNTVAFSGPANLSCEAVDHALSTATGIAFDRNRWHGEFRPERLSELFAREEVTTADQLGWNFNYALTMGALASLFALILPHRMRRIAHTALRAPGACGGLGLVSLLMLVGITAVAVVIIALLFWLLVPLLLLPLIFLFWVGVTLLVLVGWAALSLPVGTWLLSLLRIEEVSPVAAAAVGGITLTFVVSLLSLTTLTLLWVLVLLVTIGWGLGAVLLTRFGQYTYPNPYKSK